MTSPYLPNPNLNVPIFPGLENQQMIDGPTAKQLLGQLSPEYATNEAARKQLDSYVDHLTATEVFVTPRRVAEIAMAAKTVLGGTPEQIAQQNLVQRGLDLDRSKLPEELRERFAKSDGAELAQELHVMMQQFHPQRELTRQEALQLYYEKVAKADKEGAYANGTSYPILKTNDHGETTVRGVVYGDTRK